MLKEPSRVLRHGGTIYCTEVVNSIIFGFPENKDITFYIEKLNEYQKQCGGDPDMGIKLGCLFYKAGYADLELSDAPVMIDERTQAVEEREKIVENWIIVFLSVSERLIENKFIDASLAEKVKNGFHDYLLNTGSVFVYPAKQIKGKKL